MAKAAKKLLFVRDDARDAVIEECATAVPSNWLDSLLPKLEEMPLDCAGIERLLNGVADRIRALKSNTQERG